MIRASGLTKDYGSRRALSDLSFTANKGEIVGFLGPNGAGKTTTMRILTGYMPPTSGKAEIGGYDVIEQSLEVRKIVGYLPETVPLYNDLSIFEYLKFMADLRHVKKAVERVGEVLEMVGLSDRANSFNGNLSKGMRQRVGLAQALIHNPRVLILDEPTIGLDPQQVVSLRSLITSLGEERTVLLSTHILSEAQQICNRVMIINKGKIVAEDSPENLQSSLMGAQKILVRTRGGNSTVFPSLGELPFITSIAEKDDEHIEIEMKPGIEDVPAIARIIVNSGLDLMELRPISMSLEDIFLQLTKEDATMQSDSDESEVEEE